MKLQQRLAVLVQLGHYMRSEEAGWRAAQQKAFNENNWFIPEFIQLAANNIAQNFLQEEALQQLVKQYNIPPAAMPKRVGIVMAGNIPLVGFHDMLCTFLYGHYAIIKPSSKDEALIKHLVQQMVAIDAAAAPYLQISNLLKGCDAYIATGGDNTFRYFEYYFRNYPSIIRKNRTSVAIINGRESSEELQKLSDDIHQYFGFGCRNVTQLYVPEGYDFVPLLAAFDKYSYFINHHKYKNNYDYNLAMHILNNRYYMTNGSTLLIEEASPFSPISQVHYQHYSNLKDVQENLQNNDKIQCIVGEGGLAYGQAQNPQLSDFADGVDTIAFLSGLQSGN